MGIRPSRALYGYTSRNDRRILLAGLDGAGKTSVLSVLQHGAIREVEPTSTTRVEEVRLGKLRLQIWDVGGRSELRPYWRHYYTGTQGVVFVVDASDAARLGAAATELAAMAADDQLAGVPFVVLANKAGGPGALTREALESGLALSTALGGSGSGAVTGDDTAAAATAAARRRHDWELHLVTGPLEMAALQPALDFLLARMRRI